MSVMAQHIIIVWDARRPAKLVQRGDEQSEIKWLDDHTTQVLPNSQIEFKGDDNGGSAHHR